MSVLRSVRALTASCGLAALALSPGGARTAAAQEVDASEASAGWTFDARAGIALAAGELAEIEGTGPSLGAGLGYYLTPRIALRLDFGLDLLPGESTFFETADLDAWHARAGVSYLLTSPESALFVDLGAGAGITVLSFDAEALESEVRPGYALVGRVGHAIADNADLGVRSALQVVDVPDDTWTIWQLAIVLQLWN